MRAPDSANKAGNESSHSFGVNFGVSVTCVCVASAWSSRLQHLHSAKHTLTIRVSVIVWTIFSHIRINKLLDIYNQRFVVINVSSHILLCEPYMSLVACCFVSHLSYDLIADVSHFIHSFYATFVVCIITFSRWAMTMSHIAVCSMLLFSEPLNQWIVRHFAQTHFDRISCIKCIRQTNRTRCWICAN